MTSTLRTPDGGLGDGTVEGLAAASGGALCDTPGAADPAGARSDPGDAPVTGVAVHPATTRRQATRASSRERTRTG